MEVELQKIKSFLISLWRIRGVWYLLMAYQYLRRIRQHSIRKMFNRKRQTSLQEGLQGHIDNLQTKGISFAEDEIDLELQSELGEFVKSRLSREIDNFSNKDAEKNYHSSLIQLDDLCSDGIIARYALQKNVLDLVGGHLGQTAYLHNLQVVVAFGHDNRDWKGAQLWHLDYPGTKMVKLFTYFSDVEDESDGPFTIIKPSDSINLTKRIPFSFNFFNLAPVRVSDQSVVDWGYGSKIQKA